MRKICKIAIIFLIVLNLYSTIFVVNASGIWDTGKQFLNEGAGQGWVKWDISALFKGIGGWTGKTTFQELINFIWGIGLLVVFISTIILGIKYMMVTPNERSRIKQATTPYIIGVVVIFGAVTIWKLVIDILEGSLMGW